VAVPRGFSVTPQERGRCDARVKRLERGKVKLATVDPESTPGPCRVEMTADDLGLILRGIDPAEVRRRSRYRKPAPA
jgi:hypothetical protein